MKKTIEPIQIWRNGLNKEATVLLIESVTVELNDHARCKYSLFDASGQSIIRRENAGLTEEQYNAWGEDDEYFVNAIAENLGLTITGDYEENE